jgi:hypothetical protein
MSYSLILLVTRFFIPVACFLPPTFSVRNAKNLQLFSSGSDELDSMRRLLQSSWNANSMGQVPSDATAGANEAFSSILSASDRGVDVFFVDLLLPTYDITQGTNLYDEVLAVEYCIALSKCLKGKTEILVRDDKTLQTVTRMLDVRERDVQTIDLDDEFDEEDDDDFDDDHHEEDVRDVDSSETESLSDADAFRQNLMSSWEGDDTSTDSSTQPNPSDKVSEPTKPKKEKIANIPSKRYRLASLFGSAVMSQGIDMMEDVVQALRVNALPSDDEENVIILSAVSREEMVAVRSLVANYEGQKKIILVNCKLEPMPRELRNAETAYSLLPLIAWPKGPEAEQSAEDKPSPPKIVVLRRYPKDWEVYVDAGRGFQLAATTPADQTNKRRLPMEWVAGCVQRYIQSMGGN